MVGKMRIMRWPPWPPLVSVKFEVLVVVQQMDGLDCARFDSEGECDGDFGGDQSRRGTRKRAVVEIQWKGPKTVALKRSVARNCTEEGGCRGDGVVEWNEEFSRVCEFSVYRAGVFLPWEVAFTVFNGLNYGSKDRVLVIGKASLNIAEFISSMKEGDVQVRVPLKITDATAGSSPCLLISLRFAAKESLSERQRPVLPVLWSPCYVDVSSTDKAESSVKASLRKMKTFKYYMSTHRGTKKESRRDATSESQSPERNLDAESNYPFDSDSLDDDAADESEESREDTMASDPVDYKTLPHANWARGLFQANANPEDEYLVYYSHRRSDVGNSHDNNSNEAAVSDQSSRQTSKKRMLSWRKRKLSFRSPKHRGEPLLKKDCREEGGDDIDFDRRQLSSSDESFSEWHKPDDSIMKPSSDCEFGDDNFIVGSWELKEVMSRDGLMKLKAHVFFASIDQRSERAAGESACTALVAVIANWLQSNRDVMPTRSEFDNLIREGSSEWRNLCKNEEYQERFPDKHFDLETVLQAKIRPICVVPERSFIGFFHPDKLEEVEEKKEETGLDFLHGVMSFDHIWEEIIKQEPDLTRDNEPVIYVVSWNDHFFILLIDHDAYYLIDTLGERLYEGCNQAYVLKFDRESEIHRLPTLDSSETKPSNQKPGEKNKLEQLETPLEASAENHEQGEVVCRGKESCREYIKSFLAAIPIQQLKTDMKKGLVSSVHHRLQIEFHYTRQFHLPMLECSKNTVTAATAAKGALAVPVSAAADVSVSVVEA